MSDLSSETDSQLHRGSRPESERVLYVTPKDALGGRPDEEISLRDLLLLLWHGKVTIAVTTLVIAAAFGAYGIFATELYRSEVLLAPANEPTTPTLDGQLGGLATLAGVSLESGTTVEAIATLKSKAFARSFIEEFSLITVFFADSWDAAHDRWTSDNPDDWPDIRDAVKYFHEKILKVTEDRQTGLVTLAIVWKDPNVAAVWANALAGRLNAVLRQRALQEAEANVSYLQSQLADTSMVTLQQSIGRLLEGELQKVMLARGNEEFAFKIIDAAIKSKEPIRPRRLLLPIVGLIAGALVGIFWLLLSRTIRSESATTS